MPGSNQKITRYYLIDDAGQAVGLDLDEALAQPWGGVLALNRKRVEATGQRAESQSATKRAPASETLNVQSIQLDPQELVIQGATGIVSGNQPWISVLCKFADVASEPRPLSYFQNMYANVYPWLDHYWRQQSYDAIDLAGSNAAGWRTLPRPKSYYVYDHDGDGDDDLDFDRAARDCTSVADADVNFANYTGINLMFNDALGCCAYGGSWSFNLDGASRLWRTTWLPSWGYVNQSVVAHEMGHGFGLPHSGGHGMEYNNAWDVMASPYLSYDPVYGWMGQHTIAYHKDQLLGWIPAARKYVPGLNSQAAITLEQLTLPQMNNYRLAHIPTCNGNTFYTVEARRRTGYDAILPGEAVIIHEVVTSRDVPAMVMDADNDNNTGDAGAMWTVGETFTDAANGISVTVNSTTTTGFVVTLGWKPPTPCVPNPPSLISPASGAYLNSRMVNMVWQSPNAVNQSGYTLRISASSNPDAQPIASVDLDNTATGYTHTFVADDKYYWHVRTRTSTGEVSSWASRSFVIDTQAPSVNLSKPSQGDAINEDQVTVKATAKDDQTDIKDVIFHAVYRNGAQQVDESFVDIDQSGGWQWTWNAVTVTDQLVTFFVYARDLAGNVSSDSVSAWRDHVAPASAVAPLSANSATQFAVSWSGTDAASGVATYDVQVADGAGGAWQNWRTGVVSTSAIFNGVNAHTYFFRSRARDPAGNVEDWPASADASTTVVIDTQSPGLDISQPLSGSLINTAQVTVEVSASDGETSVSSVHFAASYDRGDGAGPGFYDDFIDDNPADGWRWTWDAADAPDQFVTLRVSAFDQAGNTSVASINVQLDRAPPASTVNALPSHSSKVFSVSWSGTDAASGVAAYDVQVAESAFGPWLDWQTNVTNTMAAFSGVTGRTYYFRSRARDLAGNVEAWPTSADAHTIVANRSFLPIISR